MTSRVSSFSAAVPTVMRIVFGTSLWRSRQMTPVPRARAMALAPSADLEEDVVGVGRPDLLHRRELRQRGEEARAFAEQRGDGFLRGGEALGGECGARREEHRHGNRMTAR